MRRSEGKIIPPLEVLLVEDNPGDVRLTHEALKQTGRPHRLSVAEDGVKALEFLRKRGAFRGMPSRTSSCSTSIAAPERTRACSCKCGRTALLAGIPVVVLTDSRLDRDMVECGNLKVNFINKPVMADELAHVMEAPGDFFATAVKPANGGRASPPHEAEKSAAQPGGNGRPQSGGGRRAAKRKRPMTLKKEGKAIEVLLVEDNPGDIRLTGKRFVAARSGPV